VAGAKTDLSRAFSFVEQDNCEENIDDHGLLASTPKHDRSKKMKMESFDRACSRWEPALHLAIVSGSCITLHSCSTRVHHSDHRVNGALTVKVAQGNLKASQTHNACRPQ